MSSEANSPTSAGQELPSIADREMLLKEQQLQLDRDKFELEKSKGEGLRSLLNANLGIVITAMIGLATVVVSYLQLKNGEQASSAQLDLQRQISRAQLELETSKAQAEKAKTERSFQFDVARMLLEKQNDINTENVRQVYYLRDIVMSALPTDISSSIARKMAHNASTDDLRSAWADGLVQIRLSETVQTIAVQTDARVTVNLTVTAQTTAYILGQFPEAHAHDGERRITDLLHAAEEFKLDDSSLPVLLAYVLSNTNSFRSLEENFNYSPARLAAIYPNLFPTVADAAPFVGRPQELANRLYGGRVGNTEADDGWKYRGRGYLQTTFRSNYAKSKDLTGIDLVANPDMLLESKTAAREAAAVFSRLKKPLTVASAVRSLNGGFVGLAGVQSVFEKLMTNSPRLTEGLTVQTSSPGAISKAP